jgi:hypothetical protein
VVVGGDRRVVVASLHPLDMPLQVVMVRWDDREEYCGASRAMLAEGGENKFSVLLLKKLHVVSTMPPRLLIT